MEDRWHSVAVEALDAARTLTTGRWRAMANRAYHAMFAETHARLIAAGLQPRRSLGTWRHQELPRLVRNHLAAAMGSDAARRWSQTLRLARQIRESADYQPRLTVDTATLVSVLRPVGDLIEGD